MFGQPIGMTVVLDPALPSPAAAPTTERSERTRGGLLASGWTKGAGLVVAVGRARGRRVRVGRLRLEADPAVRRCGTRSGTSTPTFDDHLIVRSLRVPRTVIGLAVGAALGLAGAVMQGVTRNPLADPGILGVNAGAALAVVDRHLRVRRDPPLGVRLVRLRRRRGRLRRSSTRSGRSAGAGPRR